METAIYSIVMRDNFVSPAPVWPNGNGGTALWPAKAICLWTGDRRWQPVRGWGPAQFDTAGAVIFEASALPGSQMKWTELSRLPPAVRTRVWIQLSLLVRWSLWRWSAGVLISLESVCWCTDLSGDGLLVRWSLWSDAIKALKNLPLYSISHRFMLSIFLGKHLSKHYAGSESEEWWDCTKTKRSVQSTNAYLRHCLWVETMGLHFMKTWQFRVISNTK